MDQFRHQNCTKYVETHALQDSKRCVPFAVGSISGAANSSAIGSILEDGSLNVQFFPAVNCSVQTGSRSVQDKADVAQHKCYQASKFYINTNISTSGSVDEFETSSSSSTVAPQPEVQSTGRSSNNATFVSSLLVGVVLILAAVAFVVWKWRSTKRKLQHARNTDSGSIAMLEPDDMVYLSKTLSGPVFLPSSSTCTTFREQLATRSFTPALSSGSSYQRSIRTFATGTSTGSTFHGTTTNRPWEDDFVVAARIPRDKVVVVHLLSRGGFGVVYSGLYNGRRVAVKTLLPETRRSISHVVDLLAEVKMMATMEHPHIIEFIGVAWDSLTNMCVVLEFMAGGDLKALLSDYQEQELSMGFNRDKLKIALHIAHALTYMHSLDPPIIHRDLKSKNVLLNEQLDAKLTDFGTSRERVNESMTGGVGTCLWMAPEVMIGDRYDDKADMFSFGVVLSELDTHASPYWHVKDPNDSSRQMPEPAILQMVASGKLHVKFSKEATKAVVKLGKACIALDPASRPTAAEALYKLHTILADDVGKGLVE
ncbi:putative serine/threonine-protein kinase/receptor [Phytophthora citrophthora]|uniref:Serine/threonine-protein kinase/receptor n=1 Tax=Phytophthora citrophthora TaxID=4793 RepID=A0AAD9LR35_9STRA|nr:putative serine/threonine-protein kinase/receptor [Phytophthora citrophthora]